VTGALLTIAGWLTAALMCGFAVLTKRTLAARMETVARACHELRGPITAARLGLQLCSRLAELSPARLRAIDLELGRASLALEDLDRSRCGGPPVRAADEVDMAELLEDSVEAWRPAAEARGVPLAVRWAGSQRAARAVVVGDRLRLAQASGNVIANAIEHGGGSVEVMWRADTACVRIEVRDRGPGLPAPVADLARRAARTRGSRGRGLAIASAIARDHGGRLAAAPSELGARLVLELPAAPARALLVVAPDDER
jgi:signal transduction histidine kinase